MKHTDVGPSRVDEIVQQIVSDLTVGKEQLLQAAGAARQEHEQALAAAEALIQQAVVESAEHAGLEEGVQTASRHVENLLQGGAPDPVELQEAIDQLVRARVQLQLALDREDTLRRRAEDMQSPVSGLMQLAERGALVAGQIDSAVDFLATRFREMGSRLESAQQSRALGLHVIRAQEEERRRLAREIHDGPAQLLNSVVLRINVCQKLFETDLKRLYDELEQLRDLVRLSLQDVRKIIFDLRPMALDDLGLVPALRAYLKDFQAKTGIEADFVAFGNDRRYDSAFEVALFRLVQEAATNSHKHSGAARISVKVESVGGRDIKLTVRDDGSGFDVQNVMKGSAPTRFGLVGMRERTQLLGGTMEIITGPGQGTRLVFTFPAGE